jgi:hypothetical protein
MAAFLPVRKERVQVHTEGGKPLFHKISVARSGLMLSKKPEISNNNNAPAWPVATVPWILWTRLIRALTFTACEQFVLTRTVPGSSRRRMRLCQCAHAHAGIGIFVPLCDYTLPDGEGIPQPTPPPRRTNWTTCCARWHCKSHMTITQRDCDLKLWADFLRPAGGRVRRYHAAADSVRGFGAIQ